MEPVTVAKVFCTTGSLPDMLEHTRTFVNKSLTYSLVPAPTMTGSVFMQRIRLFLGQCS